MKWFGADMSTDGWIPNDVKYWSNAFGEKKRHYVEIVIEKLPKEDLHIIEELLRCVDEEKKGGEFIKILKQRKVFPHHDEKFDVEKVKRNYKKNFNRLENWQDWGPRLEKYCKSKWEKRKNLLDEVFVESGQCAYEKPRQTAKNRKRNIRRRKLDAVSATNTETEERERFV